MDFQVKERFGTFEKLALAASAIQLAIPLLATQIFLQPHVALWLTTHRYRLFAGSFTTFSVSLLSAALKKVEKREPFSPQKDPPKVGEIKQPSAPQEEDPPKVGEVNQPSASQDPNDQQVIVWKAPNCPPPIRFELIKKARDMLLPSIPQSPALSTPLLVDPFNRQPFQLTNYPHCWLSPLDVKGKVEMPGRLPIRPWFASNRLPQTNPPIQPGVKIPLPSLVQGVTDSLNTWEKAKMQIEKDLPRAIFLLEGQEYIGCSAEELITQLEGQFNLTPKLAKKTACLLTQTCLPDIALAVGYNDLFPGEKGSLMDRSENSRLIKQSNEKFTCKVSRSEKGLQIVVDVSFLIYENQKVTDRLHATLNINPATDEAFYVIDHKLCDEATLSQLEVKELPRLPQATSHQKIDIDLEQILAEYLKKHENTIVVSDALKYAIQGQRLCKQILQGIPPKGSEENARDLLWHFVCCQITQEGAPSEEWTWKIEDPKGRLTSFFQSVKGCEDRISSHFKGAYVGNQKGFNFQNPSELPAYKGHALVIELDSAKYGGKRFLGLKPENYGATHPMHAIEFVVACLRKLTPGADEQGDWRKERIPSVFKDMGVNRICELNLKDKGVEKLLTGYGYPEDTWIFRDGNEVILMQKNILNIPYPDLKTVQQ